LITDMPRPRPYLHREKTRHGRVVWVVRIGKGPRVRIRGEFGSDEFNEAYRAALAGEAKAPPLAAGPRVHPGTLQWLVNQHMASAEWLGLSEGTRAHRRITYAVVTRSAGQAPFTDITAADIRDGMDRRAATPHAAMNFLKAMRTLFRWAVSRQLATVNPTEGIKRLRTKDTGGFHVWTEDEIAAFQAKWPLGTAQRLAFDVLLHTGLRKGDAVKLGKQHMVGGRIRYRTSKQSIPITLPIHADLAASIAARPSKGLTIVETEAGKSRTVAGFGTWFRSACNAAGVPGSAHGLRKAGATRLANDGASEAELEAWFGWKRGSGTAAIYTQEADRERLALMAAERRENADARTLKSGAGKFGKR
jgi:integrase